MDGPRFIFFFNPVLIEKPYREALADVEAGVGAEEALCALRVGGVGPAPQPNLGPIHRLVQPAAFKPLHFPAVTPSPPSSQPPPSSPRHLYTALSGRQVTRKSLPEKF